jgi:hypothetical protein
MIKENVKAFLAKHSKASMITVAFVGMVASVSASVSEDLTNFTAIAGNFVTLVNTVLAIFLTPPLLYFVFLGIFVTLVHLVKGMMGGGRK